MNEWTYVYFYHDALILSASRTKISRNRVKKKSIGKRCWEQDEKKEEETNSTLQSLVLKKVQIRRRRQISCNWRIVDELFVNFRLSHEIIVIGRPTRLSRDTTYSRGGRGRHRRKYHKLLRLNNAQLSLTLSSCHNAIRLRSLTEARSFCLTRTRGEI